MQPDELRLIDAYWRAANYLSVGQIYLRDNPLLREPLTLDHVKPRLLGHWGTTPGLNLLYVHMNRAIRARDLNTIYVPGGEHHHDPFDMVMLNDLDRFHLVMDVIDRVPQLGETAAPLRQEMSAQRLRHRAYTREHGDDSTDIRDWTWPG